MKKSTVIKAALVVAKAGLRVARQISEYNYVKNNPARIDPLKTDEVRDVMGSVLDRSHSIDLVDGCADLGVTLGIIGYGYYADKKETPKWKRNTYIGLGVASVSALLIPVIGSMVLKNPLYIYDIPSEADPIVNLYMSTMCNDYGLHKNTRLAQSIVLGIISTTAIVVGEL